MASVIRVNSIRNRLGFSTITIDQSGVGIDVAGIVTATKFVGALENSGDFTTDDWIVHAGDTNTKFGFPDNDVFAIETAGNERLRIQSTGQILYSAAGGDNQITSKRTNAAGSNGNYFFHLKATNDGNTEVGGLGFHRDTATDDSRFIVKTRNTGGSSQERLRITSGGDILIGTTTLDAQNLIDGSTAITPNLQLDGTGSSANTSGVINLSRKTGGGGSLIYSSGDDGGLCLRNTDGNGITLFNGTTKAVRVKPDGKVGIGTDSPLGDSKVHILETATGGYRPLVVEGTATNGSVIEFRNNGDARIRIGSAGANNLSGSSATDGLIRSEANMLFAVGNSEKLRITSTGQMGLGVTPNWGNSAYNGLHVHSSGGTNAYVTLTNNATGTTGSSDGFSLAYSSNDINFLNRESGNMLFTTNGAERMHIASGGGVGISTTLVRSNRINIAAPSQAMGSNLADGGGIMFQPIDSGFATNRTYPGILWSGNTASLGRARAGIVARSAANNDATDILFLTRSAADGSVMTTGDEKMRIMHNSHIRFHCTTSGPDASNAGAQFEKNGSNTILQLSSADGGANHVEFYNQNGQVGRIHSSGSGTTYAEASDYRLKENQVAISDGFTRVKALKPYRFNFKSDPSRTFDGFFAHEAATVVPEAVVGDKDAVKDGEIEAQGIDKSKLVPLLTAALQEAIGKIETLEVEVAALKSS